MNLQEGKEVKVILSPDIYENLRKLPESRGQSLEETAGWVLPKFDSREGLLNLK